MSGGESHLEPVAVSVVVATLNRADELGELLASLEGQSFRPFEVVVVNDGSTDHTAATVERLRARSTLTFRLISQENRGVSAARNAGIAAACGRYIAFTDDDCLVPPDWLAQLHGALEAELSPVVGVGGPLDTVVKTPPTVAGRFVKHQDDFNHVPVFGSLVIRHRHISLVDEGVNIPYLRTSNAIFNKEALLAVGGFDEEFRSPGGEDPDLCYRLISAGGELRVKRGIRVLHKSRDSFDSYFRSLRNYLRGEFRKSRKRHLYQEPVIRRTYQFLLLRKLAVAGVFTVAFPASFCAAVRRFGLRDGMVYAVVTLASKYVALGVTMHCQYDELCRRFN